MRTDFAGAAEGAEALAAAGTAGVDIDGVGVGEESSSSDAVDAL
jgi:hypothetical protein